MAHCNHTLITFLLHMRMCMHCGCAIVPRTYTWQCTVTHVITMLNRCCRLPHVLSDDLPTQPSTCAGAVIHTLHSLSNLVAVCAMHRCTHCKSVSHCRHRWPNHCSPLNHSHSSRSLPPRNAFNVGRSAGDCGCCCRSSRRKDPAHLRVVASVSSRGRPESRWHVIRSFTPSLDPYRHALARPCSCLSRFAAPTWHCSPTCSPPLSSSLITTHHPRPPSSNRVGAPLSKLVS
jgi:hypothetical protein